MTIQIRDKSIGDGAPCFVVFEAGPTHNGLESAKRLTDLVAKSGADAVKFQILTDPDRLVSDCSIPFTYGVLADRESGRVEMVTEPLRDIIARRAMPPSDWRALKSHADGLGLAFFATVGFPEDVEMLREMECDSIKIASADVNYFPLIRQAARTGLCLQIDTGSATLGEIERAVDVILAEGNDRIIIHHCPTGYPARLDGINLNLIPTLKRMFPFPVAYSDHSPGWEMDVAAVALGANMVEKTITEDRATRSAEHVMSLEPHEMDAFLKVMRTLEHAMGSSRRIMNREEEGKRVLVRRSAFTTQATPRGTRLADMPLEYRRPGHGIGPDLLERLGDPCLARDLPAGTMIRLTDLMGG